MKYLFEFILEVISISNFDIQFDDDLLERIKEDLSKYKLILYYKDLFTGTLPF
jgi:hypothetical protein